MTIRDKIRSFFSRLWIGLGFGLKETNDTFFTQAGNAISAGQEINKQVEDHRVSKALLRGEVTQEVKELRWRTYKISREAGDFTYYTPLMAKRRDPSKKYRKDQHILNPEGYHIVTVQSNNARVLGVNESMDDLELAADYRERILEVAREDDAMPRFRMERYCTKVAVLSYDDNDPSAVYVDLYFSRYDDGEKSHENRAFLGEVRRVMDEGRVTDTFECERMEFESNRGYGVPDGTHFVIGNLQCLWGDEYDGCYVVRYQGELLLQEDFFDEMGCESIEKKYREKARKETTIGLELYDNSKARIYHCERCGKEIVVDETAVANAVTREARLADEAPDDEESTNMIEYMDAEMIDASIGRVLCKDCLEKELDDVMESMASALEKATESGDNNNKNR